MTIDGPTMGAGEVSTEGAEGCTSLLFHGDDLNAAVITLKNKMKLRSVCKTLMPIAKFCPDSDAHQEILPKL